MLWIGGPPGAGKTTIAGRLARRHGLRLYSSDTRTWAHRDRAIRSGSTAAIRWEATPPEERWAAPPAELLERSLHRERGPMIVDDLLALPRSPLVVAEGSTVPAASAQERSRAVWLIPTPELQCARLQGRGLPPGPLALYQLLAETIEREASERNVPILTLDGSRGIEATVEAVEHCFREALTSGPRAETIAERRALLRGSNEAVVAQVRAYHARPWAEGNANQVVRSFACECGDRSCELDVEARIEVAAAAPGLAAEHS